MDSKGLNLKNRVLSGLFWKFGERITAQIVSLIVSAFLARLLSPVDYGVVALVMVFITIANVFVSSGFGTALIQKKEADNLDFSSVFFINIALSIGLYIILFCIAPLVATFYEMPILTGVLRVLGLRIIVASINSVQQAYVSRNMLFKRFFWSTLFGTLISGIVGIYMAYKGYGVWALVAQYLTNTGIDTVVLWITVKWRPMLKCSWGRAKALIPFGWKILCSGLLDTGYSQLRNLLVGKLYTSSDLAYYNIGDKYPQIIVVNVNSSIGSVLLPEMSKYQDDHIKVKNMTRTVIRVSSYVIWPLMVGLMVVAEPLVRIVLTEKWLPCVLYLRIFCICYGLWPIHTSNLQAITAMGRSDLFLKLEIIKKSIGLISLIISMQVSLLAVAFSLIITGIISTFINATPNIKLLQYSYSEQVGDLLPPLLISIAMGTVVYPITKLGFSDLLTVVFQIVLGVVFYVLASFLTKQKGFYYILSFIKDRRTKQYYK